MHGWWELTTVRAKARCPVTVGYLALLAERMRTPERAFLLNHQIDDLERGNATVVAFAEGSNVSAGFFYVRQGDGRTFYFGGAVTAVHHRGNGIMSQLLSAGMLALTNAEGAGVAFELDVRVIHGKPNEKAFRLFSGLGFRMVGAPRKTRISGSLLDAHLQDSSEDGVHYFAQKMRANAETVSQTHLAQRPAP